jgi:FkbM family methyltransferase
MTLTKRIINSLLAISYPFSYFGQWNRDQVIYDVHGAKFKVRVWTSDKFVVDEVFKQKTYTSDRRFQIGSQDTVIDIGGHIGAFTVFAARTAKQVLVYEPFKQNYDLLLENLELNGLTNVCPFNVAVSDTIGTTSFFPEKGNFGAGGLYGNRQSSEKVDVPTTTLEEILSVNQLARVEFLKLDAEGAEYNILLNASANVLSRIDRIALEFHDFLNLGSHNYRELVRLLEANGFDTSISRPPFGELYKMGTLRAIRHTGGISSI